MLVISFNVVWLINRDSLRIIFIPDTKDYN